MIQHLSPPDDRVTDLCAEVWSRYNIKLTFKEAACLRVLVDMRLAVADDIDAKVWPEDCIEDELSKEAWNGRHTNIICRLRRKMGDLIEIITFYRHGYLLQRLGPPDNPIHERK